MYLQALLILTSLFTIAFLAIWYRTFKSFNFIKILINIWQSSKKKALLQKNIKENDLKPFYFEDGKKIVYAKTKHLAIFEYKQQKKQEKIKNNKLRKV